MKRLLLRLFPDDVIISESTWHQLSLWVDTAFFLVQFFSIIFFSLCRSSIWRALQPYVASGEQDSRRILLERQHNDWCFFQT